MKTKTLQYAGCNWSILKHSIFGPGSMPFELIFAQRKTDTGESKYICHFKDIERNKLIEVLIGSFLDCSDRYFNLIMCYA